MRSLIREPFPNRSDPLGGFGYLLKDLFERLGSVDQPHARNLFALLSSEPFSYCHCDSIMNSDPSHANMHSIGHAFWTTQTAGQQHYIH